MENDSCIDDQKTCPDGSGDVICELGERSSQMMLVLDQRASDSIITRFINRRRRLNLRTVSSDLWWSAKSLFQPARVKARGIFFCKSNCC